ncbi:MAG TPA: DUF6228 family protein, partial [Micromonosporaceae bacterium]|nr:DUF6228 family protein [Micromonosporaceae bacterium]
GYATGGAADLAAFMGQLTDDWRGWQGSRVWHALEHEMTVEAVHDGRGHIALSVTLRRHRRAYAEDAWSACRVFVVEAGEEMTALARDIEHLLSARPPNGG